MSEKVMYLVPTFSLWMKIVTEGSIYEGSIPHNFDMMN